MIEAFEHFQHSRRVVPGPPVGAYQCMRQLASSQPLQRLRLRVIIEPDEVAIGGEGFVLGFVPVRDRDFSRHRRQMREQMGFKQVAPAQPRAVGQPIGLAMAHDVIQKLIESLAQMLQLKFGSSSLVGREVEKCAVDI